MVESLPAFDLSQPLLLNEVLVKMSPDPSSDEPLFHVSHIDRVYTLKTETLNERCAPPPPKKKTLRLRSRRKRLIVVGILFLRVSRTMWVQKIKAASEHFIETEKKKREKAYQGNKTKKIFLKFTRRRLKVYKAKTSVHPPITMMQEQRVGKVRG